jgi:hypothetical protein
MGEHYNGIIPEGSIIKIIINDDKFATEEVKTTNDMKIEKNSLMLFGGKYGVNSPICIDYVEKVTPKKIILNTTWQDCLVAKNGVLFSNYSDAAD